MRKYGEGKVLRDKEQQKTAAQSDWTPEDQQELEEEIEDADE